MKIKFTLLIIRDRIRPEYTITDKYFSYDKEKGNIIIVTSSYLEYLRSIFR